jgi:hypothetical protein
LSEKPVQLGLALHREQGSWQAVRSSCLTPGWCLSQQGRAPVVSHRAGARQGLMGGVGSGLPTRGWGSAGPEGQWVSLQAVGLAPGWGLVQIGGGDPSGRGSRGTAKGWVFWCAVATTVCGSRTELWPGADQGAESSAERSSGSADLWGGDLACRLFLY